MRWVDLNSAEFESVIGYKATRRFTLRCIEIGAMVPDNNGNLYIREKNIPIKDIINGEEVGVRYCKGAAN